MLEPGTTAQNNADSNMTYQNSSRNFGQFIEILNHVIDALGEFKNRYDKKFNISELSKYLRIPKTDIDELTSLILNFQDKYETVFKNHCLKKRIVNDKIYLVAEGISVKEVPPPENSSPIPKEINLTREHAKLLSDIIYTFQHVKRGKAFNLSSPDSGLLKNLKIMNDTHPYLFYHNSDGLIYPTELGLQLGNLLHSYNKSNKKIKNLVIENTTIIFG